MPKRNKRKTNQRREQQFLRINVDAVRGGDPIPARLPVCLRYTDTRSLTAAAGFTGYTYRGNSCFDPDQTGVGSQPVYYDQLSALYQKYRILRFHYEVSVSCTSGTGGLVTVVNTNATTAAAWASAEAAAGYPGAKSSTFGGLGSPPCRLKGTVHVGEIYGVPDSVIMADPSFLALVSANIGNSVYCAICVDTVGATDSVQIVTTLFMEGFMETRAYQGLSLRHETAGPPPAPLSATLGRNLCLGGGGVDQAPSENSRIPPVDRTLAVGYPNQQYAASSATVSPALKGVGTVTGVCACGAHCGSDTALVRQV